MDRFIGGQGQGVNTVGGSGADVRTGALKMARTTGGQAQELSGSGVDRFIGGQDRLKELTLDKVRGMKNTTGHHTVQYVQCTIVHTVYVRMICLTFSNPG